MLSLRTPPAFVPSPALLAPPAVKAAGVGGAAIVGGVLAIKTPVLLVAGGVALVGFGIFKAIEFFAQRWGYENGKASVGDESVTPEGIKIKWIGPGIGQGGLYNIRTNWRIYYREAFSNPNDAPDVHLQSIYFERYENAVAGLRFNITATEQKEGVWQWEFYAPNGNSLNLVQWPSPSPGFKHRRAGEGPFEIQVDTVREPTFPAVNPYPSYTPRTFPQPEPQTLPAPEPKRLPPLPQPLPEVEPLRVPGPEPEPLPLPLPQPSPSTAPNPALPEAEPLPNDGTIPVPAPLPIPVTDKDAHFIGETPIGGPGVGPTTLAQIAKEIGRVEKKAAILIRPFGPSGGDIGEILEALLAALLSLLPGFDYSLTEKCEPCGGDDPCPAPVYSEKLGFGESAGLQGLAYRIDALARLIDGQLGAKQLTCATSRPVLKGDWVTVRFESDAISEMGDRPLRKLFRYRSESGKSIGQLSAYWADFTWLAGNVCVIHKDAPWGTPQCWAASIDEGKRVIRFAAAESGFDPDAVGQWQISFPRNPRYGQSGSMRVKRIEGFPAVTSRDGASGSPIVALPNAQ